MAGRTDGQQEWSGERGPIEYLGWGITDGDVAWLWWRCGGDVVEMWCGCIEDVVVTWL